jgi:outer membrane protein assembly factor BamB
LLKNSSAFAQDVATPEAAFSGRPPEFDDPTNWPNEGGDLAATRHAKETSISVESIGQLGVAWSTHIDTAGGYGAFVGPAAIVGNTVYQQDGMSNVHALDKTTGEVLWTKTYNAMPPSGGPNGVAVAYGRVFFSEGLGTVHAIDAATGDDIWSTTSLIGPLDEGICMAPLVYDGVVYISTIPGSTEGFYLPGQRGIFYAIDANSGEVLWYFETTTDNLWNNPRVNSGGGLWHSPSVDEQGTVYLGVANPAPYPGTEEFPNGSSRPGENPYTNSIVALDTTTGQLDWWLSVTGRDIFDLDNHLTPIPATVEIDGTETAIVIGAGKHGIVVAANAETGEELWRTPVGKHQNDELEEVPEGEELEIYPGTQGGVQTQLAYADGVVYAPIVNSPSYATSSSIVSGQKALPTATGQLVALDAGTGEILWDVETASPLYGGATIANDVVFSAGLDGIVRGFNIADGSQVFSYQASAGINTALSISGDYLFIPAGTAFFPSADSAASLPDISATVTALMIGGEPIATPTA